MGVSVVRVPKGRYPQWGCMQWGAHRLPSTESLCCQLSGAAASAVAEFLVQLNLCKVGTCSALRPE